MSKKSIDKKMIKHVAKLARLKLRSNEIDKFKTQLADVFNYVEQISRMKTKDISETSQVTGLTNRFREDKVEKNRVLSQKEALSNAKSKHKGYFLVKSVFEK